ncbi:MAG TPA: HAMP domain-containing sensor histidine kinase [Syntrophomonadaceae bacterium]|nr:HAMP domain-containing sensor histidine kinase [Syntrophomonadaceae bacterium]
MFQQLRLKLTLINAFIILLLFILLIIGVYSFSQIEVTRRNYDLMEKLAADIKSGQTKDLPLQEESTGGFQLRPPDIPLGSQPDTPLISQLEPPPEPLPGSYVFFVKTSPSGAITFQSSDQPLKLDRLTTLTEKALQSVQPQGTILLEQSKYSYLKTPIANPPGTLVVFSRLSQENNFLRIVLIALIAVGLFCLVLSFGASYFMANQAMIPIYRAWQQQKEFLSDASHELRTPLAVILANLDAIRENSNETVSSQTMWLDNIQNVTVSTTKLVDSLLLLARSDSKQQTLEQQHFSLKSALAQTISYYEPAAAAKGISLKALIPAILIEGYGDEVRIKQVIGILLDNAIRHTSAGGKITGYLSQSDVNTVLTIVDTGEGIERQYLDKIFDRFFQVDESRNTGNSGLGLAIAKSIVEGHNGTISVASTPGSGTTFTIYFPWRKIIH